MLLIKGAFRDLLKSPFRFKMYYSNSELRRTFGGLEFPKSARTTKRSTFAKKNASLLALKGYSLDCSIYL